MLGKRRMTQRAVVIVGFLVMVSLAACGQGQASLPQGWTMYRDAKLPFEIPNPPGWTPSPFLDEGSNHSECSYMVNFFPPGRPPVSSGAAVAYEPELITIDVFLTCPGYALDASDRLKAGWTAETTKINVSGTTTTVYDRADPLTGLGRAASATFGGHQYVFGLGTPKEKGEQDASLYMTMLRGFAYTGPAS